METLTTILSEQAVRQIGWVLVHFLWQGLTAAAIMWAVLKVLGKSPASVRYIAACIGMLLMTSAPAITLIALHEPKASPPAAQVVESNAVRHFEAAPEKLIVLTDDIAAEPLQKPLHAVLAERLETALPWFVIAWAAGAAGLSLWYLGGWCQLQKLRLIGTTAVSPHVAEETAALAERLGVKRAVRISESILVQVPTMIGWLKPVILLPATALTGLDEMQLRAMIAHELAHIKRHDYLVNIVQTAFEILGFYHPAVWWMSRQIRIERENCCDDMAAELLQDRTAYAKALFSMEEIRIQQLALAMRASGGSLIDRIGRLLGKSETVGPKSGWIAILTISFVVVFLISTAVAMNNRSVQPSLTDTKSTLEFRLVANMTREQVVGFNGADINLAGYEWVPVKNSSDSVWHNNMPRRNVGDEVQLMVSNQQSTTMLADGSWGLEKAIVSSDELGNPAIEIFFDAAGREKFYTLTNNHIQRQLAICIDGKVCSAPHIMTAVRSAAIITGNFTEEEARSLATALAKGMPSVVLKEPAISGVEHYMVNRTVAEFPPAEDFSSPESAYAAINRVMASGSREGWMRVSTKVNAQRIAQSQRQDQQVSANWAKVVLNARILEVRIQGDRAMVIAEFGQELSSQKIVSPIDARSLKLEDGKWLNAGEDRFDTVEEAAQKFGALVESDSKTEAAYTNVLDQSAKFKQTAEELFEKLRSADYAEILSYYDEQTGKWEQDGWKRLDLNYTVHTDWPSFAVWVCRTFKDNPIVSVELSDAVLSEKEFDGHKAPAVPYKLTLQDGSILQGELYFAWRAASGTWQPAEGIDWHLQDNPISRVKFVSVDKLNSLLQEQHTRGSGGSSGFGVSGIDTASGQSGSHAETAAPQEFWLELSIFGKPFADKTVFNEYSNTLEDLGYKDALKRNEKVTPLMLTTEQADDFRQWIGSKGGVATLHLPKLNLTDSEETQLNLQDSQEYITGYQDNIPKKENILTGIQLALTPEVLEEDENALRLNLKYFNNILLKVFEETDTRGRDIQLPTTRQTSIQTVYTVPFDQVLLAPAVFGSETKSSSQIIFFLMKISRKSPAANSSSENNSRIYTAPRFGSRLNQMTPEEHVRAGMDAFSIDPSPKKQTENAPAQSKNDTLLLGPNGTGYFDRNTPIQIGSIVLKVARRIEAKNVGTDIVEIKSDNTERKLLLGLGGTGYFDRNAAIQIGDAWVKVDRRIEVTNTGSGTIEIISTKGQQAANRKSKEATAALYDVADLMRPSPDEDYQPGGVRVNDAIERLIKEIESIEPESWRAKGGPGQINAHGSTRLIIRQTPDMHEKIAEYLARRRIQVVIEARFLLLEELFEGRSGIDEDSERRGQVIEGYANSDEIKAAMETKPLRERNLPTIEHKPPQKVDSETEQSIIRAAQQFKNSRVLTAPKAMVLNHESASMRVGRSHSYVDAAEETKEIDQGVVLDLLPVVQDDNKTILLKTHIQMTDVLEKRTQVIDGKEYKIPWVQVTTIPFQARVESGGTILVEGPEVSVKNDKTGELEKQRLYVLLKPTALAAPENK